MLFWNIQLQTLFYYSWRETFEFLGGKKKTKQFLYCSYFYFVCFFPAEYILQRFLLFIFILFFFPFLVWNVGHIYIFKEKSQLDISFLLCCCFVLLNISKDFVSQNWEDKIIWNLSGIDWLWLLCCMPANKVHEPRKLAMKCSVILAK